MEWKTESLRNMNWKRVHFHWEESVNTRDHTSLTKVFHVFEWHTAHRWEICRLHGNCCMWYYLFQWSINREIEETHLFSEIVSLSFGLCKENYMFLLEKNGKITKLREYVVRGDQAEEDTLKILLLYWDVLCQYTMNWVWSNKIQKHRQKNTKAHLLETEW